jgi:hypothetical protein
MPGELWRAEVLVGREITAGTAVTPTRRMYWREPVLNMPRDATVQRFATATRDNVRGVTLGPKMPEGNFAFPISAEEIVEPLLSAIKSGVTPTTPPTGVTARLWTFVPSSTLDTWTVEYLDGANRWEGNGYQVDELTIAGSVSDENLVSCTLFGRDLAADASATTGLAQRVPTFIQGWQTRLYIDALGAAPGTTPVSCALINWSIAHRNHLTRKYAANNSLAACAVNYGEMEVTADLMVEATSAAAIAEFTNWQNTVARMVRVEFQDETGFIELALRRFVTVDIPGNWTAYDLGQTDEGTRTYQLTLTGTYDATNGYSIQFRAQNNRAAAY